MKNLVIKILEQITLFKQRHNLKMVKSYLNGKGIEIGPGENPFIKKNIVYVDKFPPKNNNNFVACDADNLFSFSDNEFDFLYSAHCLEHMPNAIKTIIEWTRVLKPGGVICAVLPHIDRTFDKGRSRTTLKHLINDYELNADFTDETHWSEFAEISIVQAKPAWLNENDAYDEEGNLNLKWMAETGKIHYHAWDQDTFIEVLKYLGLKILLVLDCCSWREDSFCVVAQKAS